MASLTYPVDGELQLRLGPTEDAILSVVRKWAWWTRAEVEGRVPGERQVVAVVLTADRACDPMLRDILRRSFQLAFPIDGGEGTQGNIESDLSPKRRSR